MYCLLGLPNLKSTTTSRPSFIITRSGRRFLSSPFSVQMMSHSLNSRHVPSYHSFTCGSSKARCVSARISSSVSCRPITPSNTRRLMASSMSASVRMAENSVCSSRPRSMNRCSDSSSSTPAMKSAERLDCLNSTSCFRLSITTGRFVAFRASRFVTSRSAFSSEAHSSPRS